MNFRNVLVFISMTSTAALFRSVKYMRPLALSTPAMSKEKLLVEVMFGTAMSAFALTTLELLLELLPPQLLPSVIAAINMTARIRNVIMVSSLRPKWMEPVVTLFCLRSDADNSMLQHLRYQS